MEMSGNSPAGVSIMSPPSVSARVQKISWGTLFAILHATVHALQPTQRLVSITIP